MNLASHIWLRVKTLFRKRKMDADMDEEMRLHLELLTEHNIEAGMSPEEARYAAQRKFGGVEQIKERGRDERGFVWVEQVRQDIFYALRTLRKAPGFTLIAILSLALGIGASTAIFGFINGVLLHPLPYADPGRLVSVLEKTPEGIRSYISTLTYLDWEKQQDVFEYLAARTQVSAVLSGGGETTLLRESKVTLDYFKVFGITTILGRTFTADECLPGNDKVVVLSHSFWVSQFGADRSVIGRTITLDNEPRMVIGVLREASAFDGRFGDVWSPLAMAPENRTRNYHWLWSIAKLKTGVTIEKAQTQMDMIGARISRNFPATNGGWGVRIAALESDFVGPKLRQSLYVLMAAVGLVLLIACANLANLNLTRGIAREREVAIRLSLGATRSRLIRQFMVESLMLSLAGGMAGLAVAWAATRWLETAAAAYLMTPEGSVVMDARVMLFACALAMLTGGISGLMPALKCTRPDLVHATRQGGAGSNAGRAQNRVRNGFVVAEVALTFILLIGAGLLGRSWYELEKVEVGRDPQHVITAQVPMAGHWLTDPEKFNAYLHQLMECISAVPGVRSVAFASGLPMRATYEMGFQIAGREVSDRSRRPWCLVKTVTPDYFSVVGLNLMRGRLLNAADKRGGVAVAVINETMAKTFFPDEDPIGKRLLVEKISLGKMGLGSDLAREIVGVVADEKLSALNAGDSPAIYLASDQSPQEHQALVVRGSMDAGLLQKAIRDAVHRMNPAQALQNMATLEQIKIEALGDNRLRSLLLSVFAGAALLLALMGIYGVVSYAVATRTREMGIRAALGASPRSIVKLVVHGGMKTVGLGLLLGIGGAFMLTQLLSSLLYGVKERDWATFAVAGGIFASVALVACLIPARRAAKVDPVVALRSE